MTDESLLQAYVDAYFSTFKSINELISAPMAKYHLSFEQFRILSDIAHDPDISLTAIVAKRGVTKPGFPHRHLHRTHQQNIGPTKSALQDDAALFLA